MRFPRAEIGVFGSHFPRNGAFCAPELATFVTFSRFSLRQVVVGEPSQARYGALDLLPSSLRQGVLLSVDPIAMKELHSQELLLCVERCGLRDAHALFRGGGNVRRDFIHLGF